jgi:hypothetical protein
VETRAWKSVAFDYPRSVPTMLADEEKQYLFWLGRDAWDGRGDVLEIGPWLGGSTVSLAAGMRASGHDARGRLHTVDNFLWRDFMSARAPLPLGNGESFEPFFHKNLASYHDIVVAHAAALPDDAVARDAETNAKRFTETNSIPQFDGHGGSGAITVLFVDGAKSWRGMRHLLRVTSERLIPGKSLLVCQDFKFWSTYWVPMMMARIADALTPVHDVLHGTTVAFALRERIPRATLDGLEDGIDAVDADEGVRLLEHAARWLDGTDALGAAHVRLARVRFLAHVGRPEEAVREFVAIQRAWPSHRDVSQVVMASSFLRRSEGVSMPRPWGIRLAWLGQRIAGAWRKHVVRR